MRLPAPHGSLIDRDTPVTFASEEIRITIALD